MSALLESLLDAQRRADVAANDVTPARCIRATGNHLSAQNDEPEPGDLTEADLQEIDRQYGIDKSSGALDQRRYQRGLSEQQAFYRMTGQLP